MAVLRLERMDWGCCPRWLKLAIEILVCVNIQIWLDLMILWLMQKRAASRRTGVVVVVIEPERGRRVEATEGEGA